MKVWRDWGMLGKAKGTDTVKEAWGKAVVL